MARASTLSSRVDISISTCSTALVQRIRASNAQLGSSSSRPWSVRAVAGGTGRGIDLSNRRAIWSTVALPVITSNTACCRSSIVRRPRRARTSASPEARLSACSRTGATLSGSLCCCLRELSLLSALYPHPGASPVGHLLVGGHDERGGQRPHVTPAADFSSPRQFARRVTRAIRCHPLRTQTRSRSKDKHATTRALSPARPLIRSAGPNPG